MTQMFATKPSVKFEQFEQFEPQNGVSEVNSQAISKNVQSFNQETMFYTKNCEYRQININKNSENWLMVYLP